MNIYINLSFKKRNITISDVVRGNKGQEVITKRITYITQSRKIYTNKVPRIASKNLIFSKISYFQNWKRLDVNLLRDIFSWTVKH